MKAPAVPEAFERLVDTVLAYKPKPKSAPAKKRVRRAKKMAKEQLQK